MFSCAHISLLPNDGDATHLSLQLVSPSAFEFIAINILTIAQADPRINTTSADAHRHIQMRKRMNARIHTHSAHPKYSFPQLCSSAEAMCPDGTDDASCSPQSSEG